MSFDSQPSSDLAPRANGSGTFHSPGDSLAGSGAGRIARLGSAEYATTCTAAAGTSR